MTIGPDGWIVGVVRHPGVPSKQFDQPNSGARGLALHSMEGSVAGSESRFLGPDQASVMFENPKVGGLIQMYPVTASTWTSGCFTANTTTWAIESEGVAGEPLNANQIANVAQVVVEWEARFGKTMTRTLDPADPANLIHEHREIYNWDADNAGPTSCPSGRYAPFYVALALRNAPKEPQVADDIAVLNKALVRREALRFIASNPDSSVQDKAIAALQAVGMVDKSL